MADFKEVKTPSYEYEISKLTSIYKDAVSEIQKELQRIDLDDYRQANAKATLQSLAEILSSLDDDAKEWVEKNIPKAAVEGVARTLVSLGAAETLEQAEKLAKFNRINANMVRAAVADTQADLLAVTQNINRKTRSAVRQAVAESFRTNMTQGLNGRRTIAKDIRERLEKSAQTGIIDAGGRRWKPEVYADMVTRTKMMETYNEATTNEAVGRGAYYAVISRHGAKDACRFHEGRIIKLSPDAPGSYPSYNELKASGQIWHPNCKHVYSPIRNLSLLPNDLKELNDVKDDQVVVAPNQLVKGKPIAQGKSEAISQLTNNPSMARKLGEGGEDKALTTLLKEQGFDGKGNVISKVEIDRYIKAGERELFRGVSEAKFADQFRDGDLFAGLGTYGNGTYTAYGSGKLDTGKFGGEGLKVAKDYAGSKGTIVRMTLKSDAKVVGYDDLLGEMMDYEDVLFDKLAKAKTAKEKAAIEAEQLLIKDFGRFATMRGYDAIDVRREKYLVVLNRTALRIQKENFDLKGDGGGYNVK